MTQPGQGDDSTWHGKLNPPGSTAVRTAPPVAANVVGDQGAAAGAVILTVPAGRTWSGVVRLSGQATAAVGAAAATVTAELTLAGAGAIPAPGVLVGLALALPVTTATATMGAQAADRTEVPVVIVAAAGAPATLTLNASAGMTAVRASARGVLIA